MPRRASWRRTFSSSPTGPRSSSSLRFGGIRARRLAFPTRVLTEFSHRATEIGLDSRPPAAAIEILATLLPGALDETTREGIVARADGNPLYLEELLRALLEAGGLERQHRTWTTTLKPSLLLPPALENLLVARTSTRRRAAPAGADRRGARSEFPARVLEHVAGEGSGDDLGRPPRAEIVRELRRYPELVCEFRHGLLQEATLSTLTPGRRRELYGAVATAFEEVHAAFARRPSRAARPLPRAERGPHAGDRLPRPRGRAGGGARCRSRAAELRERRRALGFGSATLASDYSAQAAAMSNL